MVSEHQLRVCRELLTSITTQVYSTDTAPIANAIWNKQLQPHNPLWKHITAKPFTIHTSGEMAHVIAMVDQRLPGIGLVGFFGTTNTVAGIEVLRQTYAWLKEQHDITDVYGPINGTITCDYRFNLSDDYRIPGEPVNPSWYVDVFSQAGFEVYNRYVSGIAKHAHLYVRFVTRKEPAVGYKHITLHPFRPDHNTQNIAEYHTLMNAIFPTNSIYCPVITLDERMYNMAKAEPIFDPNYSYFAYDGKKPIGFIVAFPHEGNLVLKTIGVLPEYRGKRISDVLVRRVHEQAKNDGLQSAIYSTTRTTTAVYKARRPGVKVFRRYVSMHKSL